MSSASRTVVIFHSANITLAKITPSRFAVLHWHYYTSDNRNTEKKA